MSCNKSKAQHVLTAWSVSGRLTPVTDLGPTQRYAFAPLPSHKPTMFQTRARTVHFSCGPQKASRGPNKHQADPMMNHTHVLNDFWKILRPVKPVSSFREDVAIDRRRTDRQMTMCGKRILRGPSCPLQQALGHPRPCSQWHGESR